MPELTVAETMFVGQLPTRPGFPRSVSTGPGCVGAPRKPCLRSGSPSMSAQLARHLSIAQQQQVECAKALLRGCRIILFDEPTSPLTSHEVERLFGIMGRLRDDGCTLGFISHRMDEVLEISDDISVLRDGALVDTVRSRRLRPRQAAVADGWSRDAGHPAPHQFVSAPESRCSRSRGYRTRRVSTMSASRCIEGEVLGLAGLVGAGRTEIAETIFGIRTPSAGRVRLGDDGRLRPQPRTS